MEKLKDLISELLRKGTLIQGSLSNLRKKDAESFSRVVIKPVQLKGGLHYQFSYYYINKVNHENLEPVETGQKMMHLFEHVFKQGLLQTQEADYQVLTGKKWDIKEPADEKESRCIP